MSQVGFVVMIVVLLGLMLGYISYEDRSCEVKGGVYVHYKCIEGREIR